MRVLFFVGNLAAGGLERFVTRISLHAQKEGAFHPSVCCLNAKEGVFLAELEAAKIPVWEAPKGWARSGRALFSLGSLVRRISPDLVHSQVNFALFQQVVAVKGLAKTKLCVTERSCYVLRGLSRLRRLSQFHTLRALRVPYSANSEAVAAHLGRQVFADTRSIPVLPNGVPLVPADQEMRARKRTQLGWDSRDVGIGYIARMSEEKGHAVLLRSLALLRDLKCNTKVCFLGDGPKRAALLQLAKELRLEPLVSFPGTVRDVEDWLQAFDIVALLSSREGMPNAILEAISAGKPVIATRVGAIPELLDAGRAGILLDSDTPTAVASGLVKLIQSAQLRQELGHTAFLRARERFSIETCLATLLAHYNAVLL